ncbi:hypothetical protein AHF37_05349 [Paragonimus kellicotti]|nr:hypothetical protein AHF37_05349 [Paragonimus kellicotti]
MPVFKPQHVDLFSNSNVTCRLRIYDPIVLEPATSSSSEFAYTNPKWTVYDSRNDPLAQTLLTAQMNLMVEVKPESMTASISWIAVVIIVISILIIIAVLVTCVVMRTRGETYLLDKEERAWGIDPVKDLCETEAFRTYERAEEPPLRGSRCSLNDDSAEIGSDADGELDDYNLDPGKFNEEGSFIDQYTTDTHYKGTPRLPTLSRSYDPQFEHKAFPVLTNLTAVQSIAAILILLSPLMCTIFYLLYANSTKRAPLSINTLQIRIIKVHQGSPLCLGRTIRIFEHKAFPSPHQPHSCSVHRRDLNPA